ncbi:MAG: cysteine desulfurase [Candidatus Bathyarchaeota archaeon]|nr:cysteine desulfurase [Candidatus Bathyarchaeota archaeon]MCX8177676.1 cysteine desulfurase [Candidatus Bathyarchaeota archaeon]MDW8193930.1 cysteine desulfurase [Nitrososphaerota archaeon]
MFSPYLIREDFPILKRKINGHPLIYFDNAATSQKPRQVIKAVKEFYEKHNANIHRAVHTLSHEATELYEEAHEEVAKFINARGMEEIVFTRGTTEAINLVAYSWTLRNLKTEDEVLLSLMEHHSNIVPWEILSEIKKFKVKYADVNGDGTLNYEAFEEAISRRTKMVCITHVSNVTGIVNDIKRIARVAHDYGALVLVDGAQSVPHMPVDVKGLDVDFLAFSGHKMLAPTGIGVLYGKRELLEELDPFHGGGEMIRDVSYNPARGRCIITWNTLPWKFEAGTPNVGGGVGLMAAIKYLKSLGMENVKAHEHTLTEYALKRLKDYPYITVYVPEETSTRSGIIPFNVDDFDSHDVALFLDGYGIMVRSGFHCAQPLHQRLNLHSSVRASFYVYNVKEEIDRLIEALKEIQQL